MKHQQLPLKQSAESDTTRQRILSAARRHFLTHGFRSVSMSDLASELGMSKKTLYVHFPGKDALLEAMLLDKFSELEEESIRITEECSKDFVTGMHRLLACFQQHTAEIQPPFVRDIQREAPELFHLVEQRRRKVIQRHFGLLLGNGRREGLIRKDVPVHLIVEILLGAAQAIMNPPRMAELGLTPSTGFSAIIRVILEGVLTTEGRSKL